MSQVAYIHIHGAKASSVLSSVFEQAGNQHVATKQKYCFHAGGDVWPYRHKAEVHGACLPWERLQRAFGLCLHNRLEAGQFYLQCGLVLTEIVLLFAVCTMLLFEG